MKRVLRVTWSLPLALALAAAFLPAAAVAQQAVPTPASVIGFEPGADFKLATYEQSIEYFRRLEQASDRIRLVDVGKTSEGRDWFVALISSPQNLAALDRYREIAMRLAHPAGLTDDEARDLAHEGRALVDISGGLHASEVAGAQHTIELAWELVSSRGDPRIDAILDNVILMLWPSLNPDGQDIVVNWYRENVGGPYETAPLHELYQKYIGHDNNRDAYMLNVPESRVIARTWRDWEPEIIYVHHQSSPFPTRIWLPPFAEPIADRTPGLIARETNAIGMLIAQELDSRGQPGATHMGTGFDAWYPGYIDYMPVLQNVAAWWTETALFSYATPGYYTIRDFPANYRDLRPDALYTSPWPGGWWRLRDAVEYMTTASVATLDYAAKFREQVLYNRYQSGRDAIRRYQKEPPFAYIVPQEQRDPMAAVELLRRLAFNGLRVSQLTAAVDQDGMTYPRGTWVIPMDQEFAELARQLLEPQVYPDLREYPGGPPEQPYDAAGWTLQYQMGVRVVAAKAPLSDAFRAALQSLEGEPVARDASPLSELTTNATAAGIVPPAGRITGSGPALAVDPAQNDAFRVVNRALAAGGTVRFAAAEGNRGGRYVISGMSGATLEGWVRELGLRGERTSATGTPVRGRMALYKPWTASMDEGWTRWLLDRYEFGYTTITNADFAAGDLRARFDVIAFASDGARTILDGFAKGSVPPMYEGGIGEAGVRALDAFVRAGGTLVCLNRSTDLAIQQLHLPVTNAVARIDRKDFFASGSILEVITDPAEQVMAGMPDRAAIFFDGSPVFEPGDGFEGEVLARYADAGSPLLSGYLLGEKYLNGRAAALEVRHGDGRVVLIGFRPQWRGQPFGTFRVLFNALLRSGG